MSLDTRSVKNELLDEFRSAIEHRTRGRLSHLSLDFARGSLEIKASSATYYVVQLALAAVQTFTSAFPQLTPAKMSFRVKGHSLVLHNSHANGANRRAVANNASHDNLSFSFTRPHNHKRPSASAPQHAESIYR